jgi:hypothetical protein
MANPSVPNARDLAELDLMHLQQQMQILERKIKTVSIENAELSSLGKGKSAYELKGKVHFLVEPNAFKERKRVELQSLKSEKEEIAVRIQADQRKIGKM